MRFESLKARMNSWWKKAKNRDEPKTATKLKKSSLDKSSVPRLPRDSAISGIQHSPPRRRPQSHFVPRDADPPDVAIHSRVLDRRATINAPLAPPATPPVLPSPSPVIGTPAPTPRILRPTTSPSPPHTDSPSTTSFDSDQSWACTTARHETREYEADISEPSTPVRRSVAVLQRSNTLNRFSRAFSKGGDSETFGVFDTPRSGRSVSEVSPATARARSLAPIQTASPISHGSESSATMGSGVESAAEFAQAYIARISSSPPRYSTPLNEIRRPPPPPRPPRGPDVPSLGNLTDLGFPFGRPAVGVRGRSLGSMPNSPVDDSDDGASIEASLANLQSKMARESPTSPVRHHRPRSVLRYHSHEDRPRRANSVRFA